MLLHSMVYMAVGMIYNMPHFWTKPAIYFSSGSATQSLVINFPTSFLQLLISPVMFSDKDNTMIWRSDIYRRGLDSLSSVDARLIRTLCLSLERHLDPDDSILSALYCRECNSTLAKRSRTLCIGQSFCS